MFKSESDMQQLVHEQPDIILTGIPEINPQFCPDTPRITSLGREIPLTSGPIDNLYIDSNAIITFVECKRYGDTRLKREVYSQVINYASDMQNMLFNYSGNEFIEEFFQLIKKGMDSRYSSFEDVLSELSKEPILSGKHIDDWRTQFIQRLENNIKIGAYRIVIACAPSTDNNFSYSYIRNLMQIMSFTESAKKNYDLILMDIREEHPNYISRIIWRSYTPLPQIPLMAQATRDTSLGLEKMRDRYHSLPEQIHQQLNQFTTLLSEHGFYVVENTYGFSIYSESDKKSLYIYLRINSSNWEIVRHQVRVEEALFTRIKTEGLQNIVGDEMSNLDTKRSGDGTDMYEITIYPNLGSSLKGLIQSVSYLAHRI